MNESSNEQRQFHRIAFDARCRLVSESGESWDSVLVDVSLKGALILRPARWDGHVGDACTVHVHLSADQEIEMHSRVAHADIRRIGFRIEHIDMDSATHLRRLVELNLGDPEILDRELSALGESGS